MDCPCYGLLDISWNKFDDDDDDDDIVDLLLILLL